MVYCFSGDRDGIQTTPSGHFRGAVHHDQDPSKEHDQDLGSHQDTASCKVQKIFNFLPDNFNK
jgi:hypothetical protein